MTPIIDEGNKKRVLHVYPRLTCGGVESVIEDMIRFGDSARFSYAVLTQEEGDNEDLFREMGVEIYRVPFRGDKGEYKRELKDFFSEHKYDIVHTHMHHQMMLVNLAARTAGVKCRIAQSHINHAEWPKWKRILRIPKFILHNIGATDLVGCSQGALDWLFPVKMRKGTVIVNGVDRRKYKYTDKKRYDTRRELGIPSNVKVVLNVGRLTPQKNQEFILDIAARMQEDDRLLFLIVGSGPLDDKLIKRIDEEGLINVRMLGERRDIPELLSAADLFILPSVYEGFPIVINEALAGGLPVAVNERLDLREFRREHGIHPLNLEKIEDWINEVRGSYPGYRILERAGASGLPYRYVTGGYDAREMAMECIKLYLKRLSGTEK